MTITRAACIIQEVQARTHIWEAYDQGRLAHASGKPRSSNHFDIPPLHTHTCTSDWYRGWDAEQAREPCRKGASMAQVTAA